MEEIANQLIEKYKFSQERAIYSAEKFIQKLKDAKVLEI